MGPRQPVLAGQQVDGQRRQALGRVGHRDRAVVHELGVAERAGRLGQRMVRRDAEDEAQVAQRAQLDAAGVGHLVGDADRQLDLARDQCLPGAGQHVGADAQPRRGAALAHRGHDLAAVAHAAEGLDELEHGGHRQHVVDADRQLRLPATGDAPHAVDDGVHLLEQAAALLQQLAAGLGGRGRASWAWRELRSNSSTSSASSSWRTL